VPVAGARGYRVRRRGTGSKNGLINHAFRPQGIPYGIQMSDAIH
jgi:hypothetical protein